MRKVCRKSDGAWQRKALALAVASCFAAELAYANPTGPTVVHGKATFSTRGNVLTVTNTPGTIIHWQDFSIPSQDITRFLQQSAASAVLNRVTGATPSTILGQLQSNGRVYLVNPNGITIGKGAVIDVAGFVASSLNLSDADFIAGRHRFTETPGAGAVVNHGEIRTATGGMVYLVGENIANHGVIRSPAGEILLAAGKSIELVDAGTPEIRVQITAPENQALNLGELFAPGGRIGIYGGLVRHGGVANADTAVVGENGRIVFKATKSVTLDAGSVTTASGPTAGRIEIESPSGTVSVAGVVQANATAGEGGEIAVSGHEGVSVEATARLEANGTEGGAVELISAAGPVKVAGAIRADASAGRGGDVTIAAATRAAVAASARIGASGAQAGGSVRVEAGDRVVLESGSVLEAAGASGGVISIRVEEGPVEAGGAITATGADDKGGEIFVRAAQDITLADTATLIATGARGGAVYIESREGTTLASGSIDAFGRNGPGGKVYLLGPRVGLVRNASVNVSGRTGGGVALVGGDFQGNNPDVPNAERTYVGSDATITADAIESGDGGKVIIWADGDTRYFGSISSRGGAIGGNGGFVEVSGKQNLAFSGYVLIGAPAGKAGTLLLDPGDLYITAGGAPGAPAANPQLDGTNPFEAPAGTDDFYAEKATIEAVDGSVTLLADQNVIFQTSLSMTNQGAGETVSVTATNGEIRFNGNSITTGGGDIVLSAGGNVADIGGLDSGSGNVSISSGGTITQSGAINANLLTTSSVGGTILNAANTVSSFDATNTGGGNIELTNTAATLTVAGVSQVGGGDVVINNSGAIAIAGISVTGGNLLLTATGAVSQSGALTITGTTVITATGQAITLDDEGNDFTGAVTAQGTGITLVDANALTVSLTDGGSSEVTAGGAVVVDGAITNDLTVESGGTTSFGATSVGGNLEVTSAGAVSQTGAISGAVLTVKTLSDAGAAITLDQTNEFATVNLRVRNATDDANAAGAISYGDATGFDLATAHTTADVTLNAGGAVTQSGSILSAGLELLGTGPYTLTGGGNNIATLAGNVTNTIQYTDTDGFTVGTVNTTGLTAAGVLLSAGGTLTLTQNLNAGGGDVRIVTTDNVNQTGGAITANNLGVRATSGINLNSTTNDANTIAMLNDTSGSIAYRDNDGFEIGTVAALGAFPTTSGIQNVSGNVTLNSGGAVTQASGADNRIEAAGLELLGAGLYVLTSESNDIATISADGPGEVSYTDTNGFTVGTVNATVGMTVSGNVTLTTRNSGVLTIAQDITTTNGGAVTLDNEGDLVVNADINSDGDVTQNGAGVILLDADIITTNDLVEFNQKVILINGPRLIDTSNAPASGAGGEIRFATTLDGGGNALTLITPGATGDVFFGGDADNLEALTIVNALDVTANGSITTNAGGAIDIAAQGIATFKGPVNSGGAVTLRVNDLVLDGTINAVANAVQITGQTVARAITIGTGGSGLGLSNAELNAINTSGMLTIGATDHTGPITVDGAVSLTGAGGPTGGLTIVNRTGGVAVDNPLTYTKGTGNLTLTANGGGATAGAITDNGGGLIAATNLTLNAATGIGTTSNPLHVNGTNLTVDNTTSGGVFLQFPTGNLTLNGLTSGAGTVSLSTVDGSIFSNGSITAGGAVELTANATGATPRIIDINAPIVANGKVILRAADDIAIDAQVSSNNNDIYMVAGRAPGMNLPGITMADGTTPVMPAGETVADTDGGVTLNARVIAGAGDIVLNATESVVQPSGVGGSAGLQNTGELVVRTYNDAPGAGFIDLRNDNNPNGNTNGPVTLETRKANDGSAPGGPSSGGYVNSNIDYRSYTGVVISTVGTSGDVVIIAATQDVDIVALNLQVRNLTLIANAGDVNFVTQVTNSQINQGNPGGSLVLLAAGDVNVLRIPGTQGVTVGRVLPSPTLDPDTGLPLLSSIEKFDHELRMVAQGNINIEGSIYVTGDLHLRANASAQEIGNPPGAPTYANNGGSVVITVPSTDPVVVHARNIVVGTRDALNRPLPVQDLIITAGTATPGTDARQSASAILQATGDLDIFLTGDLGATGGTASAVNTMDGTRIENAAAAVLSGNVVRILGVTNSDNPLVPDLQNGTNITLTGGTATATNQGAAEADASAIIQAQSRAVIDIGGDFTIVGGDATATGSKAAAVAIAGTQIGTAITGDELLTVTAENVYITSGTGQRFLQGRADGFASLATSGAITITVTGKGAGHGLVIDGAGGSGLFDALGTALIRVNGMGYPITVNGRIEILSPAAAVPREDGLVIAGAPLIDESVLAAFIRATETVREDTLGRDPNLHQRESRGQAGVCR